MDPERIFRDGVVVADFTGSWLIWATQCSSIKAELRAAVLSLHFTWDYGYKQVELEMNSEITGDATRGTSDSLNKDDLF